MAVENINKIIGLPQLLELIPLSRTQIWRLEKQGAFPARIKIGQRRIGWRASDIQKWIDERTTKNSKREDFTTPSEKREDA
jgi:prophage regulatory protein